MAEKPSQDLPNPAPTIGRIVVYRNSRGVDMPAIITALTDDAEYVHLQLFVPPGQQPDVLSYQHGTPRADRAEADFLLRGCWRWPDRTTRKIDIDLRPQLEEAAAELNRATQAGSDALAELAATADAAKVGHEQLEATTDKIATPKPKRKPTGDQGA